MRYASVAGFMQHSCTALVIVSLGIGRAAHAQCTSAETIPTSADSTPTEPATSTLPAPGWSTDVRIGIPTTFSDTGVVLGVTNFELGTGDRVGDRWYLGATAEWTLGMNIGADSSPVTSSLRGGAEARYIFHQGVASVSTRWPGGGPGESPIAHCAVHSGVANMLDGTTLAARALHRVCAGSSSASSCTW